MRYCYVRWAIPAVALSCVYIGCTMLWSVCSLLVDFLGADQCLELLSKEGWMSSIILTCIILSCLTAAIYLHRKPAYRSIGLRSEVIFWAAILLTLLNLLVTWLTRGE